MSARFADKVVLVAGGTGGLGRAVTLAFLAEGAKVAVTYVRAEEFEATRKAAAANAASLEGYAVDLTDENAVAELTGQLTAKFGRIDTAVNAVGGYAGGTPLWEITPKVFEQQLALNLRVGFMLFRATSKVMIGQKSGAIVNVLSKAAYDHAAGAAAYTASKAAALAMTDSLAADLKGTGVRVNAVVPSIIDTEANRKAMPKADFSKWPKPEEIARVILFLCSDDARVVHGAAVPVYGES